MAAGPPLARENWNVTAAASQEHCRMKPKLMADTKLMYFCKSVKFAPKERRRCVRVYVLREYLKSSSILRTLLLAGPAMVISNSFVDANVFNISLRSHLNVLVVGHCAKQGKVERHNSSRTVSG